MHCRPRHPTHQLVIRLIFLAVLVSVCLGAVGCRRAHPQVLDLSSSVAEAAGMDGSVPPGGPDDSEAAMAREPAEIYVYVSGASIAPGVYRLREGARACDALAAAGGAKPDAHLDHINLAAMVSDGQHLHIPSRAEVAAQTAAAVGVGPGGTLSRVPGPVNINRATASQLLVLPGIGPVLAGRIVAHRAANGPFGKIDDLIAVPGIGPAKLADLRPFATAGP